MKPPNLTGMTLEEAYAKSRADEHAAIVTVLREHSKTDGLTSRPGFAGYVADLVVAGMAGMAIGLVDTLERGGHLE